MNRRRFLVSSLGVTTLAVSSGPLLASAGAATDDEIAFANFGASTEFLVKDYYTKVLEAKVLPGAGLAVAKRGRAAASQHARALSEALVGAGDVAPVEEDFEFVWPARTFRNAQSTVTTGLDVLRALLGAYQSAAASVTDTVVPDPVREPRSERGAADRRARGAVTADAGAEPFPVAMDLEAASSALEAYLG